MRRQRSEQKGKSSLPARTMLRQVGQRRVLDFDVADIRTSLVLSGRSEKARSSVRASNECEIIMCAICALGNRKHAMWSTGLALVFLSIFAGAVDTRPNTQAISELLRLQAGVTLPVQIGRTLRAG